MNNHRENFPAPRVAKTTKEQTRLVKERSSVFPTGNPGFKTHFISAVILVVVVVAVTVESVSVCTVTKFAKSFAVKCSLSRFRDKLREESGGGGGGGAFSRPLSFDKDLMEHHMLHDPQYRDFSISLTIRLDCLGIIDAIPFASSASKMAPSFVSRLVTFYVEAKVLGLDDLVDCRLNLTRELVLDSPRLKLLKLTSKYGDLYEKIRPTDGVVRYEFLIFMVLLSLAIICVYAKGTCELSYQNTCTLKIDTISRCSLI